MDIIIEAAATTAFVIGIFFGPVLLTQAYEAFKG